MHVIAAKAVAFKEALTTEFITYQQQVVKNAQAMAEIFMQRGFDVVSATMASSSQVVRFSSTVATSDVRTQTSSEVTNARRSGPLVRSA